MTEWVFDAEATGGRCAFCDQKRQLDHKITIEDPKTTVVLSVCRECVTNRVAPKFSEDDSRSQNANRSQVMFPEARTTPRDASSLSSAADVLARESSGEHVDWRNCLKIDRRNVIINLGFGPVLAEHLLSVRVALDKPSRPKPTDTFKAELDSADSAKETSDTHLTPQKTTLMFSQSRGTIALIPGF